jgi:hypothetical protein
MDAQLAAHPADHLHETLVLGVEAAGSRRRQVRPANSSIARNITSNTSASRPDMAAPLGSLRACFTRQR